MDKIPPTNPPISPNANYFGSFNGRNSQNNQNSKDSSKDSKEFKGFLSIIREEEKQKKEQNNGNTNNTANQQQDKPRESQGNDSSNSYSNIGTFGGNAPMATRGYGNSGKIPQQPSSTENNPRGNREESRSSAMGKGSQNLEAGSRKLGEGSENITQLRNAETYITTAERGRFYELAKKGQKEHSILKYLLNKQNLESAIKDSLKGIENAKNTIQLTNHAKTLDKTLTTLKKICPNDFNDKEIKELIKIAEEKLAPLKEKYLSKENTHKNKSKSNDDFGMGM